MWVDDFLQKLQQDLKGLQSDLGEVSRRCVTFFEEKPTSSSVPVLRSELNLAVEHIEKLNSLSSVYLHKSVDSLHLHVSSSYWSDIVHLAIRTWVWACCLSARLKTVDVLMRSLQAAESQVRKYESRLSEEDIVPADTSAIQALEQQFKVRHTHRHWSFFYHALHHWTSFCMTPSFLKHFQKWHSELQEQDPIFQTLSLELQRAKEAGNQLSQLHTDRSPELDRYQEKAQQITERWSGVQRQMETRWVEKRSN